VAVPKARSIIRGRYQLESMIGEGGMASIWRARDLTLARSIAVKLLFARDERDRDALVERFLREARIAASVQHRNVIQIVDFGTTEDNAPFMVMELLEGEPLSGRIYRERRLPVLDVVQIACLTLRGLSAVHAAGIIHRDLKPDNIYLKRENDAIYPKILDFGISRSVEPQSGRRSALTTREGMIIGTPEYMSPEQARGVKDIDPRTDLYSMGVIVYEALSGRLPFYSENVGDLIIQIVTGSAPTLHELNPRIPVEISDVVDKAMARNREDRFANAADMQAALLRAAERVATSPNARNLSDMPPVDLDDLDANSGWTLDGQRVQRWALPLLAAGLAIYSAMILMHAHGAQPAPPHVDEPRPTASAALQPASTIVLAGVPAGASILLDGQASSSKLTLARGTRTYELEVSAPGKQPYRATITADQDKTIQVRLADPLPPPTKAASPRAKPRKHALAKPAPKEQRALRNLDF
jgi:serine/threonine protein kinase